jgi:hypothetical protein
MSSGLALKADIVQCGRHVSKVPAHAPQQTVVLFSRILLGQCSIRSLSVLNRRTHTPNGSTYGFS